MVMENLGSTHANAYVKNGSTRMNGSTLSGNTNYPNNLSIITLRTTGNVSADRFGQDRGFTGRQWIGKLGELVISSSALSDSVIASIEGTLALKWGLTSSLPSNHPYNTNIFITTGQPVNIQVPADRNPTSWSASGLASGLSINNSGVISGSTSYIGDFNATVTAINADGNDSKQLSFTVNKGQRIITWDQTFAGLTYGDSAVSLTGSATGTDASALPAAFQNLELWLDASIPVP